MGESIQLVSDHVHRHSGAIGQPGSCQAPAELLSGAEVTGGHLGGESELLYKGGYVSGSNRGHQDQPAGAPTPAMPVTSQVVT